MDMKNFKFKIENDDLLALKDLEKLWLKNRPQRQKNQSRKRLSPSSFLRVLAKTIIDRKDQIEWDKVDDETDLYMQFNKLFMFKGLTPERHKIDVNQESFDRLINEKDHYLKGILLESFWMRVLEIYNNKKFIMPSKIYLKRLGGVSPFGSGDGGVDLFAGDHDVQIRSYKDPRKKINKKGIESLLGAADTVVQLKNRPTSVVSKKDIESFKSSVEDLNFYEMDMIYVTTGRLSRNLERVKHDLGVTILDYTDIQAIVDSCETIQKRRAA